MTGITPKYDIYKVKKSDTLWTIAANHYGDSEFWQYIYQANKQKLRCSPDPLTAGIELVLPSIKTDDPSPPPGLPRFHTVRPGEYLALIAENYYGDANQWSLIYNANQYTIGPDPNTIRAGTLLYIP